MAKDSTGHQLDQAVQAQCRSRSIFLTISCTFCLKTWPVQISYPLFITVLVRNGQVATETPDLNSTAGFGCISHYLITAIIFLICLSAKVWSLPAGGGWVDVGGGWVDVGVVSHAVQASPAVSVWSAQRATPRGRRKRRFRLGDLWSRYYRCFQVVAIQTTSFSV